MSHVLKDQVNESSLSKGLLELHNIWMIKHFQDFDLAHCGPFNYLIFIRVFKLLHCYNVHVSTVIGVLALGYFRIIAFALQYNSIGSLSYFLYYLIFLH